MAKYTINYKCGHTAEIQLFGNRDERDRKIAWLEANAVCPECHRARMEQERAEATAKAAADAEAESLPKLNGTPKQIAWAETIRRDAIDKLKAAGLKEEIVGKVIAIVCAEADCRWWIDHRLDDSKAMMMAHKDAIMALRNN